MFKLCPFHIFYSLEGFWKATAFPPIHFVPWISREGHHRRYSDLVHRLYELFQCYCHICAVIKLSTHCCVVLAKRSIALSLVSISVTPLFCFCFSAKFIFNCGYIYFNATFKCCIFFGEGNNEFGRIFCLCWGGGWGKIQTNCGFCKYVYHFIKACAANSEVMLALMSCI